MLAAVYHGPEDLRVEERPVPAVGFDELLLRIESASLCATDLRILSGSHRLYGPGTIRVPGHELVGTIVELGRNVSGYAVGQRVFVAPNIGCGRCRQCAQGNNNLCPNYEAFGITMDGAFAEYMRVTAPAIRQGNVIPLPAGLDPAVAALAEPLACVLHGQEAVDVREGDRVVILGSGPIGLMHLLLARSRGAGRIVISDRNPERLRMARRLRADRVVNFEEQDVGRVVAEETGGQGADVVLVAAPSHAALEQALRVAGIGGRINFFASLPKEKSLIQLDANLVHYRELVLTGSTGSSTRECCRALELIQTGRIDLRELVSERFPLREAPAAFTAARDRKRLKVVLQSDNLEPADG